MTLGHVQCIHKGFDKNPQYGFKKNQCSPKKNSENKKLSVSRGLQ